MLWKGEERTGEAASPAAGPLAHVSPAPLRGEPGGAGTRWSPCPSLPAPPASFPPSLHSSLPKLFSSALELERLAGDHHWPGGGAGAGRLAAGAGREQLAFPRSITATHSSISLRNPPALLYPDRHTGSQLSRSRLCLLCPGTRRCSWARWLGPITHLLCGLGQASNLSAPNLHPVFVTGARCLQHETVTAM